MSENKKETEEKPKAVVEMEENSDAGKAKKRIKEKKEQDAKTANKKFIIKYAIFIFILAIITTGAIWLSIKKLNKNENESQTSEVINTDKPEAKDSKYAINSYNETYNENSLKIQYYAGNDQPVEETYGGSEYVQINGLLNKDIQNNINARLKETAKKLKEGNRRTFSYVTANFGNILSVYIHNEDSKVETINVDLTTGNDIPIEEVFVSSAPLNSLIMEGVYRNLAWGKLDAEHDENEDPLGFLDMDKVDTSEYEDIALRVVNNFNTKKRDVKYYITYSGITIYGIADQSMTMPNIGIDFIEHRDDIAIYKRYLSHESIFENDSIGTKNIIVFTENIYSNKYIQNLIYEQEDSLFIEEALVFYYNEIDENKDIVEKLKKYFSNLANEDKQRIKKQTDRNNGTFYQKEIDLGKLKEYYYATITEYQAECNGSYFKDEAFKDYAKMKNSARADIGINGFTEYNKDDFPNMKISNTKTSELYFDLNGNYIGTTEAEAKAKLNQEKAASTTENIVNTNTSINTNTTDNTNTNTNSNSNDTNITENAKPEESITTNENTKSD